MHEPVGVATCNSYHPHEVRTAVRAALDRIGFVAPRGARVLVKPNAVTNNRPEQATATHPAVLDAVCGVFADADCALTLADSSAYYFPGYTRRSFETLGFLAVAERHGATLRVFEEARYRRSPCSALPEWPGLLVADLSEYDLVVNVPKLKVHRISRLSGAVKNMFGAIPGGTKQLYHEQLKGSPDYLDRFGAVILDAYLAATPHLNVLDGVVGLGRDGPAANGDPSRARLVLASRDGLALDTALARIIGEEPTAISYLREAVRRGLLDLDAVELVGRPPRVDFPLLEDRRRPNPIARRLTGAVFRNLIVSPRWRTARCSGCGDCAARCQAGAIRVGADGASERRVTFNLDRCVRCYACPSFCDAGAIHLDGGGVYRAMQVVRRLTGM